MAVPHPDPDSASPGCMDDRVGYVNFFPDPLDQKVRAIRFNTLPNRQLAGQEPIRSRGSFVSFSSRAR